MADNDPFASIIPLCHISNSQLDLSDSDSDSGRSDAGKSRRRDATDSPVSPSDVAALLALRDLSDSEPSETTSCFPPAESTPISLVSPPGSPESGKKAVDLGRDSDLGFSSEVVVTQKLAASSDSGGDEVVQVEMSKSELEEYMAWKSSKGTKAASLDSGLVSEAEIEEAVVLGSENVGLISGADIAKNGSNEGLISGLGIAKDGQVSNDGTGDDSNEARAEGTGIAKNGFASIDSTEEVVMLDSEDEGLISGSGIAKDGRVSNDGVGDDSNEARAEGSGIAKNGFASIDSTEEVVMLDSEDEGLISGSGIAKDARVSNDGVGENSNEARAEGSGIAKNGFASIDSTEEVVVSGSEDEGLISGSGIAKDGRVSNDNVGDASNEARAEDVQHHIEDIDKSRHDSDFRKNSKGKRVLPMILRGGAQEWDSGWPSECESRKRPEATRDSDAPCGSGSRKRPEATRDSDAPSGSGSRKRTKETQVLPASTDAAAKEGNSGAIDSVIKNALKLLSAKRRDTKFKNSDILEIAKLCGMAFNRPRCWGEEEKDGD